MSVLNSFKLTDQTAIVTGGSRGLGAVIAESYADAGANVVICSRDLAACEQMGEKLENSFGIKTLAFECDVTNEEHIKNVIEKTVETFDSIDILVNNSGASWAAPVEDMPLEAWNKVIDVNVTGTFLMSQAVGKLMIEQ